MAEIEITILSGMPCHDEWRDEATLRQRVRAVETERTAQHRGISWQFTRARCTMQT